MVGPTSWQRVLAAPAPAQHIAQLYTDPRFLALAVGDFLGDGLRAGEAGIALAVPAHWQDIAERLRAQGFEVDELQARGQLILRDAAACLAEILVDGTPDAARCETVIDNVLDTARRAGYPKVRVFGELVDLLRGRDLAATIRLEELWNDVLTRHGMPLLCGYSVDAFDSRLYG